jgi:Flp pilus assembly protein TadD
MADRVDEAITPVQDAVAAFQITGDQNGEAIALNFLGSALRQAGRREEAITAHRDAMEIFRETGDQDGEA